MGRGNPIIRSYDNELYQPITYFIDFLNTYSEEDKIDILKNYCDINDFNFNDLKEEKIDDIFYDYVSYDIENFTENFFFDLEETIPYNFEKMLCGNLSSDLTSGYREYGIIIAKNDECIVLTSSDGEHHHYPIALIPAFKYEDIVDDYFTMNSHKEEWYVSRNLDFMEMIESKSLIIYNKKLNHFKKKYEPLMKFIYSVFENSISVRSSAWTSTNLKDLKDNFNFL